MYVTITLITLVDVKGTLSTIICTSIENKSLKYDRWWRRQFGKQKAINRSVECNIASGTTHTTPTRTYVKVTPFTGH